MTPEEWDAALTRLYLGRSTDEQAASDYHALRFDYATRLRAVRPVEGEDAARLTIAKAFFAGADWLWTNEDEGMDYDTMYLQARDAAEAYACAPQSARPTPTE